MPMDHSKRVRLSFAMPMLLLAGLSLPWPLATAAQIRNPNDDPAFGDAVAGERFGTTVVVDGATVAVGSFQGSDAQGNPTGSVRVFARQDGAWVLQAKLVAPYGRAFDAFGAAVALADDTLIVGAPNYSRGDMHHQGAVYVFERDGSAWAHVQTLFMPGQWPAQSSGPFFGSAIAMAGDRLAIGAPQADVASMESGGVAMFERDAQGWHPTQVIRPPNPSQWGMFGKALLFAGDELLVGSSRENLHSGAVYSFAYSNGEWVMRQRLVGSEVAQSDGFGTALAAGAGRLLVGAPAYLQNRSGFVVEWRRENGAWVESRTLRPADEPDLRHFGLRVAYRGDDSWVIGAERGGLAHSVAGVDVYTYEAVNGVLAPAAYAYLPHVGSAGRCLDSLATGGTEIFLGLPFSIAAPWSDAGEVRIVGADGSQSSLSAGVTATDEHFGGAVVANSRWLLVGTPGERRRSAQSGAVFAYDLTDFQATPAATVIDADGERRDAFGAALALSGETLLVGAPYDDQAGSVQAYEYVGSQWQRTARWTSPGAGYAFGGVLAADPAAAVVGAASEGAAYVYERAGDGWLPPVRLSAITATDNEAFGVSVAIGGGVLAVGSLTYDIGSWGEPITSDGLAYVFEKGEAGWTEVAQLARPASPGPAGDFGSAVAVAGDTLFVSAPALREVHVYQRQSGQWLWTQRIEAPATAAGSFGERVRAIEGDVWVSAPDRDATQQRGSLHRFSRSGGAWKLAQSFHGSSSESVEAFGGDFAAVDGIAFIGVPSAVGHAAFVRSAGRVDVEAVNLFGSGFEE